MLVSLKQLERETNQFTGIDGEIIEASDSFAEDTIVASEEKPLLKSITAGNILGEGINLEKRKAMISAKGFEPTEFAYERAIGINDSLYSNFTELIALTKRKVGRIVNIEDERKTGYATGFMVSECLLLTNWHVFKTAQMAKESEVHFFYEYDVHGHPQTPVIFKFDINKFYSSDETLDYCFVAVKPFDVTGKIALSNIGYLYLDKGLGKIGQENIERLNIIHHPQGDYKQISIRENLFTGIEPTKIFYETDTAQGSSGSPVFNDQWQVVGLHHKSIGLMTPDKKSYLDRNGEIIPVVDGKIDVARIVWIHNEGIRISVILEHLAKTNPGNDIVATLDVPAPEENLQFRIPDPSLSNETNNAAPILNNSNDIIIHVPFSRLNNENAVDISLSTRKLTPVYNQPQVSEAGNNASLLKNNEVLLEAVKASKEQTINFSKCKGYDPNFLGIDIPLPQPTGTLAKQVARLTNKSIELKYFKYSVIFNSVTRMPVISAVNVEGDAKKRLDKSKRSDDWLRDKRIDMECQLTDKFYLKSNFDKGHMSRFEDANWDDTEEMALRNGEYTCFYTNACPQVEKLNRAGGLWGKLEKAILEKGVKEETGKLSRMTVFNGPVFNAEKDQVFRGVTIPMEFYKIILWLNDNKELRATAFKLSQELLVDHIRFEESMQLDEEALDIDKDVIFKAYQCSITSLSKLTKIDFSRVEQYDTFNSRNNKGETLIETTEALML